MSHVPRRVCFKLIKKGEFKIRRQFCLIVKYYTIASMKVFTYYDRSKYFLKCLHISDSKSVSCSNILCVVGIETNGTLYAEVTFRPINVQFL